MDKFRSTTGLGLLVLGCATAVAQPERPNPIAAMDNDGDGAVNFQEFMDGEFPFLATMDSDANGVLTLNEFLNSRRGIGRGNNPDRAVEEGGELRCAERQARMQQNVEERFVQMDLDGDEIVTEAEFKEATFLQMDSNTDGLLSGREMRPPRGLGNRGRGRRGRGGNGGNGPSGLDQ